ncbi:hypothetical protein CLOP_g15945, partial [Closterium sp. NIES-67]
LLLIDDSNTLQIQFTHHRTSKPIVIITPHSLIHDSTGLSHSPHPTASPHSRHPPPPPPPPPPHHRVTLQHPHHSRLTAPQSLPFPITTPSLHPHSRLTAPQSLPFPHHHASLTLIHDSPAS